jgi:DNA-binding transcriptional LysR family regulator
MTDLVRTLRLFLNLRDQGSFSVVARQQRLSHTTVARAIDELEERFGVRLFHRSTRRLRLTHDGERLAEHAARILEDVAAAEADLAGVVAAQGLVRLGVTTALGLHYASKLVRLREAHPGLTIELMVADWREMAGNEALDLWLRVGDEPGAKRLGDVPRMLVAARAYLAPRGNPEAAGDLAAHDCLTYGYAARPGGWPIDGATVRPRAWLRANSSEAVHRAALSGLGIALLPHLQVAEDLAAGRLVPVLPQAVIPAIPITLMTAAPADRLPIRVKVVADFLADYFPDARERA